MKFIYMILSSFTVTRPCNVRGAVSIPFPSIKLCELRGSFLATANVCNLKASCAFYLVTYLRITKIDFTFKLERSDIHIL